MPATLHSILDTHPDMICRYDTDLTMTYANVAAATFFRTTKEAVIGTNLLDYIPLEQRAGARGRLAHLSADEPAGTQLHKLTRDGLPLYILWTNIALLDGKTLVGFQSVGRNITTEIELQREVRAKSEALQSVQQELRAVLDSVPSRIWYKDDKNTILRLNAAAADSMGMAVEDVEGMNTYDLFGDSAKPYHDDDLAVIRSGKPMIGKVEPYTPNEGEQGWVSTDKIPLTEDGSNDPRILVVSTDITAMKEQQAILQTINKNLDDFASLTSHDLQAPLRKIGISAELMEMEFSDQLPDDAKDYLRDMREGVDHMRHMIKSFLRFMRESPSTVDLERVDLRAVLDEVLTREAPILETNAATVTLPDADPIFVAGNDALLGQVFSNLIVNAVKYRHPDRTPSIQITAQSERQFWVIDVIDNGIGIDPAFSDKIFDLFSRSKPKHKVKGSGIGLALCRRIVTLHGGMITLVEGMGEGSRFRIKLNRKHGA